MGGRGADAFLPPASSRRSAAGPASPAPPARPRRDRRASMQAYVRSWDSKTAAEIALQHFIHVTKIRPSTNATCRDKH